MRTRFMPIVGIIVPDIMDENYSLMVRTMQSDLFTKGFSTAIYNSNEDSTLSQHFVGTLKIQRASGLVYVPDSDGGSIDPEGLPIVYYDRQPSHSLPSNSALVESSNRDSAEKAVSRLIRNGCSRIALLSDKFNISCHQDRIQGYHIALENAGLTPSNSYFVDPQRTSQAIETLEQAIAPGITFDSIFCTSIRLTIGALAVLKRAGIADPTKYVLGYGEHRLHRYGLLPYMAIREPTMEMAVTAADLLTRMINGETLDNPHVIHESAVPDLF